MSKSKFEDIKSTVSKFDSVKSALPNSSSITDSMKDLTKSFAEIQKSFVDNPAIKQLSETIASIHKSCVIDVAKSFPKVIDFKTSFPKIFDNDSWGRWFKNLEYLKTLEKSGWSLYHLNFQNRDYISSLNENELFSFLLSYYEDEYKVNLVKSWKKAPILNEKRKPVLEEALNLFDNHYYYGACSILMCQLYGVAEDIDCYSKKKSLVISDEDIKAIDELYGITDSKKFPKEKRKLFQKLNIVGKHILSWDKSLKFINDFVLKNPQNPIDELTVPHRNKICHGEQLNFGTQEHALKAIYIIDSLICFSTEIYFNTQDV